MAVVSDAALFAEFVERVSREGSRGILFGREGTLNPECAPGGTLPRPTPLHFRSCPSPEERRRGLGPGGTPSDRRRSSVNLAL